MFCDPNSNMYSQHAPEMTNALNDTDLVWLIKGRTRRVVMQQCIEGIAKLEAAVATVVASRIATERRHQRLVLCWDGDDIEEGSFTWILQVLATTLSDGDVSGDGQLPNLRDLYISGNIVVIYAMSTTSPYNVKVPKGVDMMLSVFGANNVFSVVAGEQYGPYAIRLCRGILELNTLNNHSLGPAPMTNPEFVQWVRTMVDQVFGDGSLTWTQDAETGQFPKTYNSYGYLLLGVAFARVLGARNALALGLGQVSIAEMDFHRRMTAGFQCTVV